MFLMHIEIARLKVQKELDQILPVHWYMCFQYIDCHFIRTQMYICSNSLLSLFK